MSIPFTLAQENLIQAKLQEGKYGSAQKILDVALRLLDEYNRTSGDCVEEVRAKIDTAIKTSKQLHTSEDTWQSWFDGLGQVSEDFMEERIQLPLEIREAL